MIKLLRFFGKLLGILLIPIFILSSFTSILLLSFDTQVFNSDFYQEVFSSEDFFEKLPEAAAVQIQYAMAGNPCLEDPDLCDDEGSGISASSQGPPSYFQALTENDWELLIRGILPADWLEDKLNEVADSLVGAVTSGQGEAEIILSLDDLKARLSGPEGVDAIVQVLDAQPECSEDDLLMMTRILEGNEDPGADFLSCRPPDDFIEKYSPHLEVLIRRSLRDVPDRIDLGKGLISGDQETAVEAFGQEIPPILILRWLRWCVQMSPLFCVSLMFLIGLLAVHSFKGLGGWWGYPLAITGLMGLGLALLVSPLASWASNLILRGRSVTGISPILIETGSGLALQIIRILFRQVRNFSLIAFGMGLAIIITSSVISSGGSGAPDDEPENPSSAEIAAGENEEIQFEALEEESQEENSDPESGAEN